LPVTRQSPSIPESTKLGALLKASREPKRHFSREAGDSGQNRESCHWRGDRAEPRRSLCPYHFRQPLKSFLSNCCIPLRRLCNDRARTVHGVRRICPQTGISTDDGRHDRGVGLRAFVTFDARAGRKRVSNIYLPGILSRKDDIVRKIARERELSRINRPGKRTLGQETWLRCSQRSRNCARFDAVSKFASVRLDIVPGIDRENERYTPLVSREFSLLFLHSSNGRAYLTGCPQERWGDDDNPGEPSGGRGLSPTW
jgi:hypothetical protein